MSKDALDGQEWADMKARMAAPSAPENTYAAREQTIADLVAALEATLRCLTQHLAESARDHGLAHVDLLCPCNQNEVKQARAALARAKGTVQS